MQRQNFEREKRKEKRKEEGGKIYIGYILLLDARNS